jgi:hypothetical protein
VLANDRVNIKGRALTPLVGHACVLPRFASSLTGNETGVVLPAVLTRSRGERGIKHCDDCAELAMIDTDHDRATRVVHVRFCPVAREAREVSHVEGHHDPAFACRQGKEVVVAPSIEAALLVGGAHIASRGA